MYPFAEEDRQAFERMNPYNAEDDRTLAECSEVCPSFVWEESRVEGNWIVEGRLQVDGEWLTTGRVRLTGDCWWYERHHLIGMCIRTALWSSNKTPRPPTPRESMHPEYLTDSTHRSVIRYQDGERSWLGLEYYTMWPGFDDAMKGLDARRRLIVKRRLDGDAFTRIGRDIGVTGGRAGSLFRDAARKIIERVVRTRTTLEFEEKYAVEKARLIAEREKRYRPVSVGERFRMGESDRIDE